MPKPRKAALFELGEQWLANEPGSPFIHRYWTEPGTGRTRRSSLRTEDLEEAKRILAEIVVRGAPKNENTPLSVVMLTYFEERTDRLASKDNARLAGRTLLKFFGESARATVATEAKQKEFAEASILQGHSLGYISRNLSVLSAAFGHSKIGQKIIFKESTMVEAWALQAKPRAKRYTPTDEEFGRLLDQANSEALFRWLVISLGTGCRPTAALDLSPAARNRDAGTLDLNPEGRAQNKKFRASVREPRFLTGWLNRWESENNVGELAVYTGYVDYTSVEGVQSGVEDIRREPTLRPDGTIKNAGRANVPRFTAYSCRHKIATVLRKARIPGDERDLWMGHAKPEGYGEWEPDYLVGCADAIDAWWIGLQGHTKRSLFAPVVDADNVQKLRRA